MDSKFKAENKAYIYEYKKLRGCQVCRAKTKVGEYKFPFWKVGDPIDFLEFHHVDPSKKKYRMADIYNHSRNDMVVEIAKCLVVCKFCHALIEKRILNDRRYVSFDDYSYFDFVELWNISKRSSGGDLGLDGFVQKQVLLFN